MINFSLKPLIALGFIVHFLALVDFCRFVASPSSDAIGRESR